MQFRERGFDGPYSVAEVYKVDSGYPGVYVLCRRDNVVYVGRSDSDVRTRLYSPGRTPAQGYQPYDYFEASNLR